MPKNPTEKKLSPRADGRYQLSVTITNPLTGFKGRVYVYGYSEVEVKAEKARLLAEAESYCPSLSFKDFVNIWMEEKKADGLEASSEVYYNGLLNKHILPGLPKNIKLSDINALMVKTILSKLPNGSRVKESVYKLCNNIFREACFSGVLMVNPMQYIHKPKYTPVAAAVVTPELYKLVMCDVAGTVFEYLFRFAWDTGLRRGEIAALTWKDVDLNKCTVSVNKARKRAVAEYDGATKTVYSNREVVLNKAAVENLKAWRHLLRLACFKKGVQWSEADTVFRDATLTGPMPLCTITHAFMDVKRRLHLPKNMRFHSFRHTHATILAEMDISPKKIQARLGHSSAAFTMDKYVHNTAHMQDGIADLLDIFDKKYGRV